MRKKLLINIVFIFLVHAVNAQSQEPFPFWNEIQKFKITDSTSFPASNQILFIGSSSFTNWKDAQQYFPKHKILNRAFGGSTLEDLVRYRYDVIYPYGPKQIIIYCGENDFAATDTLTVETLMQRFITLFNYVRAKYKNVPLAYVSMKPSPSRMHLLGKFTKANERIKSFLTTQKNTRFVNVYSAMLNEKAEPIADIFLEDNLHMNAKGYAIWKKIIEPCLLK